MKVRLCGLASLCFSVVLMVSFISSKTQSQGKSAGEDGLSQAEQDLLDEINQARAHPDVYAKYLQSLKPFFKGKDYQPNGQPALTTQEGWNAVQDGINFLSRAKRQGLQRSAPSASTNTANNNAAGKSNKSAPPKVQPRRSHL